MLHTKPQVEILPRPQVSSLTAELTLNGVDLPSDSLAIQCLPTCTCTHQTKLHGHVCCICVHPVGRDRARARLFNVWHTQILPPRGIATQWIFSTWTSINLVRCVCVCVSCQQCISTGGPSPAFLGVQVRNEPFRGRGEASGWHEKVCSD